MNTRTWRVSAWLCGFTVACFCSIALNAQMAEVKEKPAMYSYIASWEIPRAHWGEMEKSNAGDKAVLEKALADGTLVGYGDDEAAVHQPGSGTHDNWWSAMSIAGLMKVLEALSASGSSTTPVLESATKHWDDIMVSRYYNWRSGSYKGAYTRVASYKLKADAPDDALDTLSKQMVAPLLEKLLADGTILEYEIDTQAIHTTDPSRFWIIYVSQSAEGLDKVNAAIREMAKQQPLHGSAFGALTDSSDHRDELIRGEGAFK
ncbi:MAG TPA: hypothetical protein VN151_09850 [Terracidiphilus sp.]|nr:hypothetical protein [Terracidiphilus sp.]